MKWALLQRIEIYLRRSRMSATTFGMRVTRDPQLVFQMRRGRTARPPMEAKIRAFLDEAELELEGSRSRPRR